MTRRSVPEGYLHQKASTRRLPMPEGYFFHLNLKKYSSPPISKKKKTSLVEIKFSRTSVKVPQISTQFLPSTSKICYDFSRPLYSTIHFQTQNIQYYKIFHESKMVKNAQMGFMIFISHVIGYCFISFWDLIPNS